MLAWERAGTADITSAKTRLLDLAHDFFSYEAAS
jgi:hypothetical protein